MAILKKGMGGIIAAGAATLVTGSIMLYLSADGKKIKKCDCCGKEFMKKELKGIRKTNLEIDNSLSEYGYGRTYFLNKYKVSKLYEKYEKDGFSRFCEECIKMQQHELDKIINEIEIKIKEYITNLKVGAWGIDDYSKNYRGRIEYDEDCNILINSNKFFKDKDDALYSLKLRASKLGCNVIYNLDYDKQTEYEYGSNYQYTVWSATGIASKNKLNQNKTI